MAVVGLGGGWAVRRVPGGVPGLPGIEALTSTRAGFPLRGRPWAAPGVRMGSGDVSGSSRRHFGKVSRIYEELWGYFLGMFFE